jgi:hypothetical protein
MYWLSTHCTFTVLLRYLDGAIFILCVCMLHCLFKYDEILLPSLGKRYLTKHPGWLANPPTLLFSWYQLLL